MENTVKSAMEFVILAAALVSSATYGQSLEFGVATVDYNTRGPGVWYQPGFPYMMTLNSPSADIGVVVNATSWLAVHADLVYLGRASVNSLDTPSDANYNQQTRSCNGQCWKLANYVGSGNNFGVKLTLEPHYKISGWDFGVEVGPYFYLAPWTENVYGWTSSQYAQPQNISVSSSNRPQIGGVVGLRVSRGPVSMEVEHYVLNGQAGPYPPIYSAATRVSLNYRW